MTGAELIRRLTRLPMKELVKPVRFPTSEYLGAMREVKSITTNRPDSAEGPDSVYLLGYERRE